MNDITNLEIWILKWIVAPFITVILVFSLFMNSQALNRCEKTCHDQGFADFKYYGRGKHGGGHCYCLTAEQAPDKDKQMKLGTKIF